jgi:hypothetical protein
MRYLQWQVVVHVVASVFSGYLAAAVLAPEVSINKIKSPPPPSPAVPPPLHSVLCCWCPLDAAPVLLGVEVDSIESFVDRTLPLVDLISRMISPRLSLPANISAAPALALASSSEQSRALELASSIRWFRSWYGFDITAIPWEAGILVQANSSISGDDYKHIFRSSVCFFNNSFTGPLSTDALCAASTRVHL